MSYLSQGNSLCCLEKSADALDKYDRRLLIEEKCLLFQDNRGICRAQNMAIFFDHSRIFACIFLVYGHHSPGLHVFHSCNFVHLIEITIVVLISQEICWRCFRTAYDRGRTFQLINNRLVSLRTTATSCNIQNIKKRIIKYN